MLSLVLYVFTARILTKCLKRKLNGKLYKNAACCLAQILKAAPYKTASVWPFTSHLINYPSKTYLTNTFFFFFFESYSWTQLFWPTSKNLHSSTRLILKGRRLTKSDDWLEWLVQESRGSVLLVHLDDDDCNWSKGGKMLNSNQLYFVLKKKKKWLDVSFCL